MASRKKAYGFLFKWIVVFTVMNQPALARDASVHLLAVDPNGKKVSFDLLSFKSEQAPSPELAAELREGRISGLELGRIYLATIRPTTGPSLQPFTIRIEVNNFETVAVATVRLRSNITTIGPIITPMVLKPAPKTGSELVWVTVTPAFSTARGPRDFLSSTVMSNDGRFALQGVREGLWILTVFRDGEILATKVIEIPAVMTGREIEIDLGSGIDR